MNQPRFGMRSRLDRVKHVVDDSAGSRAHHVTSAR
jgi:hypothetical protein